MENFTKEFKSIFDLLKAFPDEQTCINHLEALRWEGVVVSPFDATSKVYKCPNNRYKCKNTNKYFNVRTATIFEDTKLPLQKWFLAHYIFSSHKKGISSHQLAKDISITQKSAWFVLHRLRHAYAHPNYKKALEGVTEIDETFVGGKAMNKHNSKRTGGKPQRPVIGMLQRGGHVIAVSVPNVQSRTLYPIIIKNIKAGSVVNTDQNHAYDQLWKLYNRHSVNHSLHEYVRRNAHTNGIENFWSQFKRGIIGIYHQVSPKHLQSYVDEYTYRYNSRIQTTQYRFDAILANVAGKRLTYDTLINRVK